MKRNFGIDILKVFSCAGVVSAHFGATPRFSALAVPIFMFVAAYLSDSVVTSGDWVLLRSRLIRLYCPFLAWGAIYSILYFFINEGCFNPLVLILQFLIGVPACPPLYFIFLLALSTCIAFLVLKVRWGVGILALLCVFCVVLQYTGVNAVIFNPLELQPRCALGRFAELVPYAIAGLAFAWYMRECRTRAVRLVLLGLGVVLLMAFKFAKISMSCQGFGYQGLGLFCVATGMSILSILIGDGREIKFGSRVAGIAGCTAGIYYIHLLVGKCIEMPLGRHRGLWEVVFVGFASLLIVSMMKRIRALSWLVR